MKAALKNLAVHLKSAPYFGKPVRFAIAVYRLPRSRVQLISVLETLPRVESAYRDQLPALLETVSKLNHRQHEIDRDLPVALRKLRRDINESTAPERESVRGLLANVDYLLKRVEFVRRELMFEMRYGAKGTNSGGDSLEVQPKVMSPKKLSAARAG